MDQDQFTLTAVDTTKIQSYVFGSNRLRENVGASELVRQATGRWLREAVKKFAGNAHNIRNDELDPHFRIEDSSNDKAAEVIYDEMGTALIIFRKLDTARSFACELTRRCLLEAPGLSLVVAHAQFNWEDERGLSDCNKALQSTALLESKDSHLPSAPLLGLGVTAACQATGLVAVQTDEHLKPRRERTRLISSETAAKLETLPAANGRLKRIFKQELTDLEERLSRESGRDLSQQQLFAHDIDNLARVKGEESYVAIVHADGNRMGEHLRSIADANLPSRGYANELREFSQNVKEAGKAALKDALRMMFNAISFDTQEQNFVLAGEIPLQEDQHLFLPFRPLVFGGDDVTFICNAQIGMSLAAEYLRAFETQAKAYTKKDIYSRAGIAMVKMHYPFARAYALSESLSGEAKKAIREQDASALDWHFATAGLSGSLPEIRRREYKNQNGTLLMRPLTLHPASDDQEGRAWFERIEKLVRNFQGKRAESEKDPGGQPWEQKRNKVKALREALRGGPMEVERMLAAYKMDRLPELLPASDEHIRTGWNGDRCVYFDAIELTDQYIDLREYQA